uniref:Uncharacterized protein n=1 Tax=Anguilla anguilla TaxID=7936 RepID=A0A0E9PM56_ANGAN
MTLLCCTAMYGNPGDAGSFCFLTQVHCAPQILVDSYLDGHRVIGVVHLVSDQSNHVSDQFRLVN